MTVEWLPPTRPSPPSRRTETSKRTAPTSRGASEAKIDPSPVIPPTTGTLKPQHTGRRSRSDSPLSEGEQGAEEAPLKRQNSMGGARPRPPAHTCGQLLHLPSCQAMQAAANSVPRTLADDGRLASRSSARGEAPAPALIRSHALAQDSGASSTTQQQMLTSELPSSSSASQGRGALASAGVGSPRQVEQQDAALLHGCPPYGTKSVIGRRPKMEDACVAMPYLAEVPVLETGLAELLPPRLAPQLRNSRGPADANNTAAEARSSLCRYGSRLHDGEAVAAGESVETLHFFGVFDGHGGADAALHCARTLHERVRQVLVAWSSAEEQQEASRHSSRQAEGEDDHPQASSVCANTAAAADVSAATSMDIPPQQRLAPSSAARSDHQDAVGAATSASSDNSSSNFLECEVDGAEPTAGSKVVGVASTETIEAALTKAFHITGEAGGSVARVLLCCGGC